MTEREVDEMAKMEKQLQPPTEEMPIPAEPKKRTRKARKLAWNERQYGAGLVAGIFIGIAIGVPIDAALAVLAKLFVGWLTAC